MYHEYCMNSAGRHTVLQEVEFYTTDKFGNENIFLGVIFKQTHSNSKWKDCEGYEIRALRLNQKSDKLCLWVTNFNGIYQNTMIKAFGNSLRQKSIPENLIILASKYLDSDIYSSTDNPDLRKYDIDKRHDSGTKVWERLKVLCPKRVEYLESLGQYVFRSK